MEALKKHMNRQEEIFQNYLALIDEHLQDIVSGKAEYMFELRDFAAALFIHPTHFSTVLKQHTGLHPCYYYEQKLLKVAKDLLSDPSHSVADVARTLTYDPSNFTKWFKQYAGMTPKEFRKQLAEQPNT